MQKPLYVIIKELEINKSFVKQGNLYLFKTKLELIGYDVQIVQSLREVQRKPRIIQLNQLEGRMLDEISNAKEKYPDITPIILSENFPDIIDTLFEGDYTWVPNGINQYRQLYSQAAISLDN